VKNPICRTFFSIFSSSHVNLKTVKIREDAVCGVLRKTTVFEDGRHFGLWCRLYWPHVNRKENFDAIAIANIEL
jgi:hypothetical protein